MLAQKARAYKDYSFREGEEVIYKEDGKTKWSGPAKIISIDNVKVKVNHDGYARTVHKSKVMPLADSPIYDATDENEEHNEEEGQNDANGNQDVIQTIQCASKLCKIVQSENNLNFPQLTQCDICKLFLHDSCMRDFGKVIHKNVCDECKKPSKLKVNEDETSNIMTVSNPKQEVIDLAKEEELQKWKDYEAFEEINEQANLDVLSSRWVITQRGDKIKARLVVRGFQENEKPQADAPTANRELLRIFSSITANEKFDLKTIDVRSAFLQSNPIDRTILIKPPKDVKKEGKVWRLKKACYGLVDASRQFYMSVKDELNKFGMQMADNDEALYYHHNKNGNLDGLLILHVDDFLVAGSESFLTNLPNHLRKRFDFSKMERTVFQ